MLAHLAAKLAAVHAATLQRTRILVVAGVVVAAATVAGCMQNAPPLTGDDPADPHAGVAGVGYRSTIAPYRSMRPTPPSPWREQNDRAAPAQKSGQ